METATQPTTRNVTTCEICQSSADRYDYGFQCQKNTDHVADLITGIFSDLTLPAPSPQETSAQQERHSALPWTQNGTHIMSGEILVTQISGSNRQFLLPEFENEANAALIVKCVNRDPAFQKLLEVAETLDRLDWVIGYEMKMSEIQIVDEALDLAREALRLARGEFL